MRYFLSFLLFVCSVAHAQTIPKNANTIEVQGITFKEVVNRLLDSNYSIAKIDSNFLTVETAPIKRPGATGSCIVKVRIKDSVAIITGTYRYGEKTDFQQGSIGWLMAGSDARIANYKQWGSKKYSPFKVMNNYAFSFGKPVTYKTL